MLSTFSLELDLKQWLRNIGSHEIFRFYHKIRWEEKKRTEDKNRISEKYMQ